MIEGLVMRSTGSWYEVQVGEDIIKCRTVGKLRLGTMKVTNPLAVGDRVAIEMEPNADTATIKEILDRTNYIIRQSPRKKHYLHILAANIEQAVLIVTIRQPKLKQGFIDRFILMTEPFDIPVHIFFNKGDVYTDDDLATYEYLKDIYENIGYKCYLISAKEHKGFKQLETLIEGKTTLFSGQSGVGKSSIINGLAPDLDLKVGVISDYMGKGQHTTTFAEMFDLGKGTKIIDTPGIKTLSYNYLEVQDVAHNFREFFEASSDCKFPDCTHRNEPKCAVKERLESGVFSELRYNNYLKIIDEVEEQNYWERNKS
jgi:ribosome biogenesis GTPase